MTKGACDLSLARLILSNKLERTHIACDSALKNDAIFVQNSQKNSFKTVILAVEISDRFC